MATSIIPKSLAKDLNTLSNRVTGLSNQIGAFTMKRFTVNANVATTINVEANTRIVMVTIGANQNTKGMYLITANTDSALDVLDFYSAPSITYTLDTGTLTLSSPHSCHAFTFILAGGAS